MEIFRMCISGIGIFLIIFYLYLLLGKNRPKWSFINYKNKLNLCIYLSLISLIIGNLITYFMYGIFDIPLILFLAFNLFLLLLKMMTKVFSKKNSINEIIEIKAGNYNIISSVDITYGGSTYIKNIMKVIDDKKEEKYIMFNIVPPELNKDLILDCTKTDDNSYICNTYIYTEKKKFFEIIKIIFNYYVMFAATFSSILVTNNFLNNISSKKPTEVLIISCAYAIFCLCYGNSKHAKDTFSKFFHILFLIFYIITIVEMIFIWF